MSATLEGRRNYAEFDEYIDYQLQKTRVGVKLADVFTAACGVALLTVSYLLVFVIFDHWVIAGGFGYGMRVALLSGLLVAALALIGWKIALPWLRSVTRLYAAKSLEGVSPDLQSNLLNYVDLRDSGRDVSPTIIRSIEKRAAVTLSHTDVEDAVDRRLLLRLSYGLLAAVVLFSVYTVASPKKVWPSVVRVFAPWSDTSVSTQTEFLSIQPGEDVEVVAGEYLDVLVDLRGEIPDTVTLDYTTNDHSFVNETVDLRQTEDGLKQFRCTLSGQNGDGLLQSLSYRVTAGDAVSPEYRVIVKQPPSASVTGIRYDFPDYMEFPAQSVDGPNIETWEGTRITIEARTNVPVKRALLQFSEEEQFGVHPVDMEMTVDANDPTRLSVLWQPIHHYQTNGVFPKFYRIQCRTPDGTENPAPAVHTIRIKVDQKPDLVAVSPAEDREVPANAIIPFLAKASDPDFRLSQVVLQVQKANRPAIEHEIYSGTDDRTKSIYDLKLADLGLTLRHGDILEWWIEARDNRFVEGPDPRNPNRNRVLLEANVAVTPPLKLIIRDEVEQQEVEEQHEFERNALEERLDEANTPNEAEPFNQDNNPPDADNRNFDPDNPPQDNDPGNTEQQPASDQNSDEPQNGAEQTGEDGQPSGQEGEGTTEGSDGQTGTESGATGTEDGDATGAETTEGDDGNSDQRPLSNTGEDDDEVLRELLRREAQRQQSENGADNPQPNTPQNPSDDPQNSNPDGAPPNEESTGNEGSPDPNGNTPDGTSNEVTDPSNPDGNDSTNQESNPEGSPGTPDGTNTDPENTSNPPSENDSTNSDPANNTDPQPGSGNAGENPSTPDAGQTPNENGNAGSNPETGSESPNADGNAGPDSGSENTDSPGESASGENPGSENGSDPDGNQSSESGNTGENTSPGSDPNSETGEDGNSGSQSGQDGNSGSQSGNSGSQSNPLGSQSGNSGSSGQPGSSNSGQSGNNSQSGNSGSSGSNSESGSGQSGNSGSQSGSGGSESGSSGSGNSDTPSEQRPSGSPGEGDSPSDSNSETGSENSNGSGSSNSESSQSGNSGESGSSPNSEGSPSESGSEGNSDSQSGEGSNSQSGNSDSQSGSQSGSSGSQSGSQSGSGQQSGSGSGQNGQTGSNSGSSGTGNPGEGSANGPPSRDAGEGERVLRDPNELDPNNAAQAQNAGGTLSNPNAGEAEQAPLEDRLKATNMMLKRLKDEMKRGEVDDELLKKLGWTEQDMQRFVDRMERNMAEPEPNDARDAARRRQFEESLRSLDLKSSGGERLDEVKNKRDTNNFSDRRLPVPRQYRQAYEDITRRLSRQQKGRNAPNK